ncbi:YqeG family HAD IIIA-type phosphatase [bacterium]|nr:YqeG family HAD IIIA-type phosphatase [bacterium]
MIYPSQIQILRQLLTPNLTCESIHDLPLEDLINSGFTHLLFDADNTLITMQEREASLRTQHWIQYAKSVGFQIHIISNNRSHRRIERLCQQLDVEGLYRAVKPLPHAITHFANERNINLKKSVIIGDQLLTDVIVANWVRAYSVLVDPLDKRLSLFKTVQREIELYILGLFK